MDSDPDKGLSRYRREDSPRYYLKHEVLGSGVSVPTHLFKVYAVRDPQNPEQFAMSAFVVRNGPVDGTTPLSKWNVSRDQLVRVVVMLLLDCGSWWGACRRAR